MMLCEYKGKQFRVSDRTWESFERDHPEKAACIKRIKESEEYYNYDKLNQIVEPPENLILECIKKNYDYVTDKYDDATMNGKGSDIDKYFGAKEMVRKLGIELVNYDPENNYYRKLNGEEPIIPF